MMPASLVVGAANAAVAVALFISASILVGVSGANQPACTPLNSFSEGYLHSIRSAYGPSGVGDVEYTMIRVGDGFPVVDPVKINRVTSDSLCAVAAGAFARRGGISDSTRYLPITVLTIDTLGYAVTPHHTMGTAMLTMTFDRAWTQIGGSVQRDTTRTVMPAASVVREAPRRVCIFSSQKCAISIGVDTLARRDVNNHS